MQEQEQIINQGHLLGFKRSIRMWKVGVLQASQQFVHIENPRFPREVIDFTHDAEPQGTTQDAEPQGTYTTWEEAFV